MRTPVQRWTSAARGRISQPCFIRLILAPIRDCENYAFRTSRPEEPHEMKSLGTGPGIDRGFFADDDDGRLYLILGKAEIHQFTPAEPSIKRHVAQIDRYRFRFLEGLDISKHGSAFLAASRP